jgi:hypothetical protein
VDPARVPARFGHRDRAAHELRASAHDAGGPDEHEAVLRLVELDAVAVREERVACDLHVSDRPEIRVSLQIDAVPDDRVGPLAGPALRRRVTRHLRDERARPDAVGAGRHGHGLLLAKLRLAQVHENAVLDL